MIDWLLTTALGALLLAGLAGAEPPTPETNPREATTGEAPQSEDSRTDAPPVAQGTVVTATRLPRPVRDVPSTVIVLPRAEIDRSPSLTQDGLLRTVPSAATFRRTSSLVSDPTAQGLNLRGLAPSGVSRSLVLVDGIPANDPFGGWVYWRSLPRLGMDRVEVVPSGGSALYGSAALGGVVQIFSRPITGPSVEGDVAYGLLGTGQLAVRAADRWGPVGAAVETELLTTHGHPVVAPEQRGAIDQEAPSNHATLNGRVEVEASPALRLGGRVGLFRTNQNGGTTFTTARAESALLGFDARLTTESSGQFDLQLFGRRQRFEQRRARVAQDRSTEVLSAIQDVPADEEGGSLMWTAPAWELGGTHVLAAGADVRRVAGTSDERLFPATANPAATALRRTGGEQRFGGLFLQDLYTVTPEVELMAALRWDVWRNVEGTRRVERLGGEVDSVTFADRSEQQLSPRLGVRWRPWEPLTLRASGYRSFRAPTLNELYRPFQVGTVLTAANETLRAERLIGGEAGVEASVMKGLTSRVTGFWNELEEPIINATLETPLPDGTARQRQNLGRARVRGVEASTDWRVSRQWTALLAYTFVDSEVRAAPGNPDLVGKQLAQDPAHRATAIVTFDDPALLTATLQLRVTGPQFEDDLNERGMGGYAVVDAFVSRRLVGGLEVFAAVENLLDRRYLVGRAGIDTLGQPLMLRGGLRLRMAP
ncbi:TonB-dependent receptor [Hyalangium rubrum]|uniref:TonB-dependent receptor n=1 Tax=Hyalangium rubrum TaxID=3103134 RepID=A0ABU5H2L7_9BACT|nr:TonB-dependent receptor [Hyalangium sp. s54d21]MDY7227708.1 TonB-dependent receptor [Hyalangium sp. s54d21]